MVLPGGVPSNILRELREQTRAAHEALERKLDWSAICTDRALYRDVLQRFYGIVRPWEVLLDRKLAGTSLASMFEERGKTHLLEQDLRCLGMRASDIATIQQVSIDAIPHRTMPHVLGAAYVMEGSTLGGQIIARTVTAELALPDACGALYFSSYGTRVGSMWKAFGEFLQQHLVSEGEQEAAIHSAGSMFELMDAWLSEVLV